MWDVMRPRWNPSRQTVTALVFEALFAAVNVLAVRMIEPASGSWLKSLYFVGGVVGIGVIVPLLLLLVVWRLQPSEVGLGLSRLPLGLLVSVVGALMTAFGTLRQLGGGTMAENVRSAVVLVELNGANVGPLAFALMHTLSVIFVYLILLRHVLERAFGAAIALIGAALCIGLWGLAVAGTYRFFGIGLLWVVAIRATGSLAAVFPLWNGAGAFWTFLVTDGIGDFSTTFLGTFDSREASAAWQRVGVGTALIAAVVIAIAVWRMRRGRVPRLA